MALPVTAIIWTASRTTTAPPDCSAARLRWRRNDSTTWGSPTGRLNASWIRSGLRECASVASLNVSSHPSSPAFSSSADSPIITVFGSSRSTESSEPYRLARQLGEALAQAGFAVASGGYGGVMEAVSRGAAEAGGRVIGVLASSFSSKPNRWVRQEIVVADWEQRLRKLIALGDGYVACPGGTGTLVELAVAWEKIHKRLLPRRPLVVLGNFWRQVVEQIEAADPKSRGVVFQAASVPAALEILRQQLSPKR